MKTEKKVTMSGIVLSTEKGGDVNIVFCTNRVDVTAEFEQDLKKIFEKYFGKIDYSVIN